MLSISSVRLRSMYTSTTCVSIVKETLSAEIASFSMVSFKYVNCAFSRSKETNKKKKMIKGPRACLISVNKESQTSLKRECEHAKKQGRSQALRSSANWQTFRRTKSMWQRQRATHWPLKSTTMLQWALVAMRESSTWPVRLTLVKYIRSQLKKVVNRLFTQDCPKSYKST